MGAVNAKTRQLRMTDFLWAPINAFTIQHTERHFYWDYLMDQSYVLFDGHLSSFSSSKGADNKLFFATFWKKRNKSLWNYILEDAIDQQRQVAHSMNELVSAVDESANLDGLLSNQSFISATELWNTHSITTDHNSGGNQRWRGLIVHQSR